MSLLSPTKSYYFLIIYAVIFCASIQPAQATTYTVNSERDVAASSVWISTGTCHTGSNVSGQPECTLRAAIQTANYSANADTIIFSSTLTDPICLSLRGTDDTAALGDLDITEDLTITGNGARTTIIDGGNGANASCTTALRSSIFAIPSGSPTVTIQGLTISGGGSRSGNITGSGLYVDTTATVELIEVNIEENITTGGGGGISNRYGEITVTNSSIAFNESAHLAGGGIYSIEGTMNLTNVTVFGNEAFSSGGGIYSDTGDLGLYNSAVAFNSAAYGGGLSNLTDGNVILRNSVISDNTASTQYADCYHTGTSLNLYGVNLIADTTGCGSTTDFSDDLTGDVQGWASTDYGDHGGETDTLMPAECSVDLDQGEDCEDESGLPLTADQRGEIYGSSGMSSCPIGPYLVAELSTWYIDSDGDGQGSASTTIVGGCGAPSGYVTNDDDCNDSSALAYTGASEVCGDSVDNDCNGAVDESDAIDATTWYLDSDGDSYGNLINSTTECTAPSGYVAAATDCDDSSAAAHPGATELCDGVDNDCDGTIDESGTTIWYYDGDGDGYGDAATTSDACSMPSGYVSNATDCNDASTVVHSGVTEICDGIDNDCDGETDEEASDAPTWYLDNDGDGFGDSTTFATECTAPVDTVANDDDCNDHNASVMPGATETCDGVDNNCDGSTDESGSSTTWYYDEDGDGYGDATTTSTACSMPANYVTNAADCEDMNADNHPGAVERCDDESDNNCDGVVNETTRWYPDGDNDGYGDPDDLSATQMACAQPTGFVADATDCDDFEVQTYPGAIEICDGGDNDCDGISDEDTVYYPDADGDGYGNADPLLGQSSSCGTNIPAGYVLNTNDCNDTSALAYTGATEVCGDAVDNDCNGTSDEGSTWYPDADGDGYGDENNSYSGCVQPDEYTTDTGDCDDTDASIHPGEFDDCGTEADGTGDKVDLDDDGDLIPDYTDLDDDGDGISDGDEISNQDAPIDIPLNGGEVDDSGGSSSCGCTISSANTQSSSMMGLLLILSLGFVAVIRKNISDHSCPVH